MNKIDEALLDVKNEILSLPEMKEFLSLKALIEQDKEIQRLDKEIHEHQKAMCKAKDDDEIYFKEKKLYEDGLKLLNENPLYQNYLIARENARELLLEVKEQLQWFTL